MAGHAGLFRLPKKAEARPKKAAPKKAKAVVKKVRLPLLLPGARNSDSAHPAPT